MAEYSLKSWKLNMHHVHCFLSKLVQLADCKPYMTCIAYADSVSCTVEHHAVLQSLRNSIILSPWQFRLLRNGAWTQIYLLTYLLIQFDTQSTSYKATFEVETTGTDHAVGATEWHETGWFDIDRFT